MSFNPETPTLYKRCWQAKQDEKHKLLMNNPSRKLDNDCPAS
jgi:hypothetical protein